MKAKTIKATTVLIKVRDHMFIEAKQLRDNAETTLSNIKNQANELVKAAKVQYHKDIIEANRLDREAKIIQEAIDTELEEEVKNIEAFEFKGDGDLIDLWSAVK